MQFCRFGAMTNAILNDRLTNYEVLNVYNEVVPKKRR